MLRTFTWRHVLAIALVICLGSMIAGAVFAQDEPDLPEPEVPVIDLSTSAEEPVVPVEPDLPEVQVQQVQTVVISPTVNQITNPSPSGVANSLRPTFTWQVNVPLTPTTFNFELFSARLPLNPPTPEGAPLTSTLVSGTPIPLTPTCSEAGLCTLSNIGYELVEGRAYYWKVTSTASPSPSAQASFIVDLPLVSPAPGERVSTTTPYISFEQIPGVQFYQLASYVPSRGVVAWIEWFAASDTTFAGFENGICENNICRARPKVQLTQGTEALGDTPVQIWMQPWDGNFGDWRPLFGNTNDTFIITAPSVTASFENTTTPGRPRYLLNREITTIDTASGLTVTATPDYYRIYTLNPANSAQFVDEWYQVNESTCTAEDVCELVPYDGVQELLFNGDYDFYVLGYDTENDAYTAWSSRGSFRISEPNPNVESIRLAGLYESIGPNPVRPAPKSSFNSWVSCSGVTPTANTPICETGRPILHFQPNVGSFSGEWFEIIAYEPAGNTVPYIHWHNVYGGTSNNDPNSFYFNCSENTGLLPDGSWQFPGLTCFFQLGELNGLEHGKNYQWYIRSYGPGTFSTGGILGYTNPAGPSDPASIASFQIRGENPVENLGVNLMAMTSTTNTNIQTLITNEPRFFWDEAVGATWYEIRVRAPLNPSQPNAEREIFYQQWHQVGNGANNIRCINGVCAFTPPGNFYLLNGTYELSVRYWNGGMSSYASSSFTVSAAAPVRVENTAAMIVYNNEDIVGTVTPVFQWPHAQGNTWYQLRLTGPNATNATTFGWYRAFEVCKPDANGVVMCAVRPSVSQMVLEAGSHQWSLDSWSPIGQAPVTGLAATFDLSSAATGVINPVYPVSPLTHTLTNTNTLELYFTPAANASWYQVYIGQQNADGSYPPPVVFDWYYLPSPETYEYPADVFNRCGDNDMTFGILNSTRPNLCRIIPTTTAPTGEEYPLEIWVDGQLQWWTQAYGPRGFSTQGVAGTGWVRGDITFNLPTSTGVDQLTIRNQEGISLNGGIVRSVRGVFWERTNVVEWYEVFIVNETNGEAVNQRWIDPVNGGCAPYQDSTCFLDIARTNVFGSPSSYGIYTVRVRTWSRLNAYDGDFIEYGLPPANQPQFVTFTIL